MKKKMAVAIGIAFVGAAGVIFWRLRKLLKNKGQIVVIDEQPAPESTATDISKNIEPETPVVEDIFKDTPRTNRPMPDLPEPKDDPFIISEHDYQIGRYSRFNETKLVYYQDDGILVIEANDIPVESPIKVIGEDALWKLEQTDEDCLYVHDDAMMMNYEIQIVHGGYADDLSPDDDE